MLQTGLGAGSFMFHKVEGVGGHLFSAYHDRKIPRCQSHAFSHVVLTRIILCTCQENKDLPSGN